MLTNRRLPNSLLLAGDEGVGKRQFALELAKAVLCKNPINFEACGECPACHRIAHFAPFPPEDTDHKDEYQRVFWSNYADVGTVVPYKNGILVDAIRHLTDEANFTPYEGQARFFLIDEADKLNPAASNALLKTLEEPPPTSHLILITSRPDSLLQTIRSRCQIIRFALVEARDIEAHLLADKRFTSTDAKLLARISRGSIGRALSLNLDNYKKQREVMFGVLESLTGQPNRARLLHIAEEINDTKSKDDYETQLETLQNLIHDVWNLQHGLGAEKLINPDLQLKLEKIAAQTDPRQASKWLHEIEILRENLLFNLNRKIATDALFLKMANA
jgi:DNA polymerase-3 subunit delta'